MKTIIAGSRTVTDYKLIEWAVKESGFNITEVVSGRCKGPDRLGEQWAAANGVKVSKFPAEWQNLSAPNAVIKDRNDGSKYNAMAGFDRNLEMAKYADALIAVAKFYGKETSAGTADMISKAEAHGLKIYIKRV